MAKPAPIAAAVASVALWGTPLGGEAAEPRVVNITSDSAPGWLPSEGLERDARKTAEAFFKARDAGRGRDAYALLDPIMARDQPYDVFAADLGRLNGEVGTVKERRILKVTWTKDPAQAPAPGVYAAIDLAAHFATADRYCGFVVLYQPPSGGAFRVMRIEENFITNGTAEKIRANAGQGQLDAAWQALAANCPAGG
jgi:hypothetical protein